MPPQNIGKIPSIRKGKAPLPSSRLKTNPRTHALPRLGGLSPDHGTRSTSFCWMDKSLLHIVPLQIVMNHGLLDGPHTVGYVGRPMTLKLDIVLVNLHVGTPGGEEMPPRPLYAVLIPGTASRVYECSRSLNNFQFSKNSVLIIWRLSPQTIGSAKGPSFFKSILSKSLHNSESR
jgi:hypothetical protein